jgi:PAS domain S-box-containing protein
MSESPARALARESVGTSASVVAAAAAAAWIVDALIHSLTSEEPVVEAMFHPTAADLWTRLLLLVLLVLVHRLGSTRHRLYLLSSALASAPDGIQITDLEGVIRYSNAAVRNIYGFSPKELTGRHVNDMNADPTFASRVILPALATEGRWEGELEVKHKDGHTFPIWLTTAVLLDARRRPAAAIGVIRDVSQRKRTEQELREYAHRLEDATRLKDLFADILRHDLLGPAATVQLSIGAVLRRDADPVVVKRILGGARRSIEKLVDIVEGAAKYAKLSTPQEIDFATVDLAEMLREVVAELDLRREERKASIAVDAPGEYRVRANAMLGDVFENLVSNALKYGPMNGTIRIDVRDDGDSWRVSVADRGDGIPDADKQKLFTRFERLRKEGVKGTGLGLAIAKRIVDLHRGRIWVEDNPGGGSVFCVALPKEPWAAAAVTPPSAAPPQSR